jgi:hypothetical protein
MLRVEDEEKRSPAGAPWSLGSGLGPIPRDDARFLGFPQSTLWQGRVCVRSGQEALA